ncbi:MAG TPA: dual specificity protein phosphatase family protein [Candidatus Eisenbacteria bacterium]|nr:dual specificity protein phosphatase family protein [Candidatus Eisenbacteria bacterium]
MRGDNDWYGVGGGAVRPSPPRLDRILPQLFVGEYPNLGDVAWLRDAHGITAVVCLQDDADLASKRLRLADLRAAYAAAGLAFDHLPVPDGDAEFLADRLPAIVERVRAHVDAGAVVYLHCNGGLNRAPTAAIAYVHVHEGLPLPAASEFVKERRGCIPYVRALDICYGRGR